MRRSYDVFCDRHSRSHCQLHDPASRPCPQDAIVEQVVPIASEFARRSITVYSEDS
ncbi:MAG: hypothetical protein HC925_03280 [Coleofasciculaceae cyanobacterium SM2_3_26]|nr:hypothetical protein [Coleofasciculaceae cyanobacterium SM2_3_26]